MGSRHIRGPLVYGSYYEHTIAGDITAALILNKSLVLVNKSSGAATAITLPAMTYIGQAIKIVDAKGDAGTNNITVTPASGNINGSATYVMDENYESAELFWDGTNFTADISNVAGVALSGLLATATEINRAADVSTRLIAAGATLTLTVAAHEGKTILLDTAAGSVVTLPAATGTGAIFKFLVKVIATSNSHIVKVANGTDIIQGIILAVSDNVGNPELGWIAGATDDTITLNRSTTGSVTRGEWLEIQDVASGLFTVRGSVAQTGTEATPFSATV